MLRRTPRVTRTYTLFPYTSLCRSLSTGAAGLFVEIVDDRQAVPDDDVVAVPQYRDFAARGRELVALAPVRPVLVIKRDGDLFEGEAAVFGREPAAQADRKSTRMNSSH